ncbi:hypothetical protein [Acidithiobacillus sulfuriphilus]|uniref:Uncharacterized protein n=1 Tax=Acidithiobacillus sulfuriphilus TaxID=1867749 RepID=A0ACD5HQ48_9PROT|nr:hypothetical protein [Acidithiobacillus sulfuriphilus]
MDSLEALIKEGPDPRYALKSVVLARFDAITNARQMMRTWSEIEVALGLDASRWKSLAACYKRVEKGLASGKLKRPTSIGAVNRVRGSHGGSSSIDLDKA